MIVPNASDRPFHVTRQQAGAFPTEGRKPPKDFPCARQALNVPDILISPGLACHLPIGCEVHVRKVGSGPPPTGVLPVEEEDSHSLRPRSDPRVFWLEVSVYERRRDAVATGSQPAPAQFEQITLIDDRPECRQFVAAEAGDGKAATQRVARKLQLRQVVARSPVRQLNSYYNWRRA